MLRYTSHSAYQFLSNFLPLPSEPLLRKLKSRSVITSDALCLLRDNGLIGNDIVLLLDEMYLQPQVQFTGTTLIGCDDNLKVYKSILTFMVVSLKRCVPFVLKAIPLVKLSHILVRDMIISCIISLTESNFQLRSVISDNHSTNVGAYKDLLKMYPIQGKNYSIFNPKCHLSEIYLMYDTVHLVKNIRNNLLASRFLQIPEFSCITNGISIHVTAGNVHWSHLHQVHAKDLELNAHLRKAPKVGYKVLHPGNNKQSVPLALAIFEETTFTAIRSYLPEEHTTADFLQLIHFWWLIVNSKERFHPNPIGNALKMNDSRCDLLSRISLWLENWRDDKTLGLSRQAFDALIKTNRAIADLSNALLSEGYEYVLTGRFQTDPLEGRFLVSLNEVMRSESIIKIKCMLERDFELSALEDLSHDYVEEPVDVFIEETKNEDLSNLTLSSDSEEVVVYIAGYISHCLLKRTQCECCIRIYTF